MKRLKFLTQAAIIAAIYLVLTLMFSWMSYRQVQVRVSEALTVLPYFTPAAIPGLAVGCLLANILGGSVPMDMIFGSLATLIAAFLSYKMPRKYLVPLPPVIINAVVVGPILRYAYQVPLPLPLLMGSVALGELIACYVLGYPLLIKLEKYKDKIFKLDR